MEAMNPDWTASIGAVRSWHMLFAVKSNMKTNKQDLDQAAPKGTVWSLAHIVSNDCHQGKISTTTTKTNVNCNGKRYM